MKNVQYIILAMIPFIICGCEPITPEDEVSETEIQTEQRINEIDIHDLEILIIDKCEYIFYKKSPSKNQGFGFMAHKGNCKNTVHYYSQNKRDQ